MKTDPMWLLQSGADKKPQLLKVEPARLVRLLLFCDHNCRPRPCALDHGVQQAICTISPTDLTALKSFEVRQNSVLTRARPVGEERWTNNRPVEIGRFHKRLLSIFVGVNGPDDEGQSNPLVQKTAMSAALTRPDPGDHTQPAHASPVHRRNGPFGALGEEGNCVQEDGTERPGPDAPGHSIGT